MTLDELAIMLELPEGHRLHAVDELPAGYCPGLSLTITSDDDAPGAHLPRYQTTDRLMVMDMATYRKWGAGPLPLRHVPRREPEPAVYTPAKPPVAASPEKDWPRFPGEGLNYRGETEHADPGDEHMGGPRL